MKVYRVEHIDHRCGPFSNYFELSNHELDALSAAHSLLWWSGPPVHQDCKIVQDEHSHRHVVCRSIEQLSLWCGRARDALEAANYIVAIYEVDDVLHGQYQSFAVLPNEREIALCSEVLLDDVAEGW